MVTTTSISTIRRWSMLGISLTAALCTNVFVNAVAFLIPAMSKQRGTGPAAFAVCGWFPLAALPLIPVGRRDDAR
jgi:hypothetical protein